MPELEDYRYRGARALVLLHERELRAFLASWRRAVAWGVRLPASDDPHYASLAALLHHVLNAAGNYLRRVTKILGLPDPGIEPPPPAEEIEEQADAYLEHLLERWREPLRDVTEEMTYQRADGAERGDDVESILEHAVVHPMRHAFQLEELMEP